MPARLASRVLAVLAHGLCESRMAHGLPHRSGVAPGSIGHVAPPSKVRSSSPVCASTMCTTSVARWLKWIFRVDVAFDEDPDVTVGELQCWGRACLLGHCAVKIGVSAPCQLDRSGSEESIRQVPDAIQADLRGAGVACAWRGVEHRVAEANWMGPVSSPAGGRSLGSRSLRLQQVMDACDAPVTAPPWAPSVFPRSSTKTMRTEMIDCADAWIRIVLPAGTAPKSSPSRVAAHHLTS